MASTAPRAGEPRSIRSTSGFSFATCSATLVPRGSQETLAPPALAAAFTLLENLRPWIAARIFVRTLPRRGAGRREGRARGPAGRTRGRAGARAGPGRGD